MIGLLWFFVTLIPVIGLVQVGSQAMADRYTYISLIGPFISIAWLLGEVAIKNRHVKTALVTSVLVILFVFAGQSRVQAGYWKNDLTLADHALSVTQYNFIAYNLKGNYLLLKGSYDDAATCLTKAVSLCPILKTSRMNIGWIRLSQNRPLEAIKIFEEILKKDSTDLLTNLNCGKAYDMIGDKPSTIRCFSRALAVDSTFYAALYNLALTYRSLGEFKTCRQLLMRAIMLHPEDPDVYRALGSCCLSEGKKEEAQQWLQKSLSLSHAK
jgi:tetratricopeptide (TPR) repeat protein